MCGIYQMLAFQHWGGTGNTNRKLVGSSLTAKIFIITSIIVISINIIVAIILITAIILPLATAEH